MPSAFIRRPKGQVTLISQRDYDELQERGWVVAHDYVEIDSGQVVMEVDQSQLTSKLVGFATSPGNVRKMAPHVNSRHSRSNPLLRPRSDLVTIADIAKRTERNAKTIREHMQHDWPQGFMTIGASNVFIWREVKAYFRRRGLAVRQRSEESNKRPSPKEKG